MTGLRTWELWQLPRLLRGVVLSQFVVAVLVAAAACRWTSSAQAQDWVLLGVLAAAGVVSDHVTARMGFILATRAGTDAVDVSVTTASVWISVAIAISPSYHVVMLAAFLTFCGDLRIRWSRGDLPAHRFVFNIGLTVTASVGGWFAFDAVAPDAGQGLTHSGNLLLAGVAAYLAANLLQCVALGTVLMVAQGRPYRVPWEVLRSLSSGQLTLVSLGLLLAVAWGEDPLLILAGLPTVALMQQALLHHQLREAAAQDPKTGLASSSGWRSAAVDVLDRTRGGGGRLGVLVVDLDHFKSVNDTYGHLVGDEVLVAVAKAMAGSVRASDLVGRFGGEEFVVLLPDADRDEVEEVAERLRLAIAATGVPLAGQEQPLHVTASVGASLYPEDGTVLEDLLGRADRALYAAKHAGRNRLAFPQDAELPAGVPSSETVSFPAQTLVSQRELSGEPEQVTLTS